MNTDAGHETVDEGRRSRRTIERLTQAGKPEQTKEQLAQSPSRKSVDQSKPTARNVSRGPKEKVKEAVRGIPSLPAWLRRLGYYGLALLFVAVAATVRWALAEDLRPTPFLVFYLAWVGAAAFGGLGPGLLATAASWLCVDFLFDSAPGHVGFSDPISIVRLVVLLAGGSSVSLIAERMRRGRIHERRQGRELAELVQLTDLGSLLILDEQDRIVRWSEGCARLYGFTAEQAIGRVSHELLRTRYPQPLEAIQATLHKTGRWEGELAHRRADGSVVHVASLWVLRDNTSNPAVLEVNNDITDSKRAKEQLARSERRHRLLFETMLQGVVYQDADGKILSMNPAAERILGKTPTEFLGQTCVSVEHDSIREDGSPFPGLEHPSRVALRTGQEVRDVVMGVYDPREKTYRWINITAVPLFPPGQDKPYQVYTCFDDITARRQAEQALRELNATLESRVAQRTAELEHRARQLRKLTLDLSQAEDRERKRLAEILHDDLQQVLAAAKFHLGLLNGRMKEDAESQEIATQVKDLLKEAIDKSRSLSHELISPALSHSDLLEIFEWLAEQMQTKHGFMVHLDICDRIELASEPLRVLLYKAAQELLFNAIKHAGVGEATLRLRRRRGRIRLSVSDQGRGFDPTESGHALGFGLLSIRERVELLGGRMKIRSAKGKGSTFLIAVPDSEVREGEWLPRPGGTDKLVCRCCLG